MPSTFEFFADCRNTNSSVQSIEVHRTRAEFCSNHIYFIFRHQNDETISTEVIGKRIKALVWTQRSIVLDDFDFIKFDATENCPGVRDLAGRVFGQEHHMDLENLGHCHCVQWV